MTPMLWALLAVLAGGVLLCIWAAITGRPDSAPAPRHAAWGEGRTVMLDPDETGTHLQAIRIPPRRWYNENPWPHDGPHGWGEIRD